MYRLANRKSQKLSPCNTWHAPKIWSKTTGWMENGVDCLTCADKYDMCHTKMGRHMKKGPYGFPFLWFFNCACAVLYLSYITRYRHTFFAWSFKASTTRLRTAKALSRLRLCAGSLESLLIAFLMSTLFSCADPNGASQECRFCMLVNPFSPGNCILNRLSHTI